MASDLETLQKIRSTFGSAAASCNKQAKTIVQATSEMIALRKHGRRGKLAKLVARLR